MCCSTERHTAGQDWARPKRVRLDPTLRAPGRGAAGNGATQHTLPRSTVRVQNQKTRSAEQTLPRISLGPGAQPNTHRDRRGPGQLGGEMLRPSTRPDRPRPMRTDGPGRDGLGAISLHFMHEQTWLSPRFDSDITYTCSALEIRVENVQNPRPPHLCKHTASARVVHKNGGKYMHENKCEMGSDLLVSLGSRLKSPRCKFGALALAPSTEMKS